METNQQFQVKPQFLRSQTQSQQAYDLMQQQRRSANYKPNIWKHDFLQFLSSKYDEEECKRQAERLQEDVKHSIAREMDLLSRLELVDNITKLGLASLFEKEIKESLDTVSSSMENNPLQVDQDDDLYATALCFRLLRQNGYQVSQDSFRGLVDETGAFLECKCANIKGLTEVFEASHLATEGEKILAGARTFSTRILKAAHLNTDSHLAEYVTHALELPYHRRVQWFDVKWQINAYSKSEQANGSLLQLAKVHFNMVQAGLQKDLREISRWWRNLGLMENLTFTRDRLVESFLCTVGLVFEPKYSYFRKWLTKVVIMILVIDDVYDVYGSPDELRMFTNAVDRWDSSEIQQLPECMKICFKALHDITGEMGCEMQREKGWSQVQPHLQKVWADFCKSMFVEAKWYYEGHTPSLQEYLSNAWISSAGTVLSVHSFFSIMNEGEELLNNFLVKNQDMVHNISLIIRLCNDLGTSKAEQERGDAASSIVCYMTEMNVSEEAARSNIVRKIDEAWKKINGKCFSSKSSVLQLFADVNTNMARVVHNLYQFGDGFGAQDREENKRQFLSLLVEPFKLD